MKHNLAALVVGGSKQAGDGLLKVLEIKNRRIA